MKYIKLVTNNCFNGVGQRVVLWVSGCSLFCEGCCNPESWDPNYGKTFTSGTFNKILKELKRPDIDGITITGGDPLYPGNLDTIYGLVKSIREIFKWDKSIWVYTGQRYERLQKRVETQAILSLINVLVDGPFILEKQEPKVRFRGSRNQRLIDCQESLKKGKVVTLE